MEMLRGVVERLTYHNEETGYTVARLVPEQSARLGGAGMGGGSKRELTIVGNMMGINVGESVELGGKWIVHSEYGRQFQVEKMRTVLPATVAGIEKYLGSGLIRGVGPEMARRIVHHFGAETLEIIEQRPEELRDVPGIGEKRQQMIISAWVEQKAIKEVMLFLQSHGVTTALATKIYKYYGDDAIGIVRSDPYRLSRDIYGIGFLTADKIARALGIPANSPARVAAGLLFALNEANEEGHVYLPTSELVKAAQTLLDVTPDQIGTGLAQIWSSNEVKIAADAGGPALLPLVSSAVLDALANPALSDSIPQLVVESGQLFAEQTVDQARDLLQAEHAIYLTPFFYSEVGVAGRLLRLVRQGGSRLSGFVQVADWEAILAEAEAAAGMALAPQQRTAVQTALTRRVTVLTGGPGTGKTTTVRTILQLCRNAGHTVLLAAPTGRAAKRLAETTGQEAKTLHRLLEFQPSEGMSFKRNDDYPLEGDLLIVDESSMLDLVLTNHLFKAIPPGMHLLLVGDVDQLPSVGAGNVLKDIIGAIDDFHEIESPYARHTAVVRLETIFRQSAGSYIITNAHRINRGELPVITNQPPSDFYLFKTEETERASQLVVELVKERIPSRFAIPSSEIQVLSPMHRGVVGVGLLNERLQAELNPPGPNTVQRQMGNRAFRAGDRVMQIRNNYDKEVYNGDLGIVTAIDLELQRLTVMMDGKAVPYDFLELDELVHAFAISVHKSQGSEFAAVVIPILTTHHVMLQRNLIYTAITRARQLVVLVGQMRAIAMAVKNDKVAARYSGLRSRLLLESV